MNKGLISYALFCSGIAACLAGMPLHAAGESAKATYQYYCLCTVTHAPQARGPKDCNFKSFSLKLSGANATIDGYFHGTIDASFRSKKARQKSIRYRGFEQMDMHDQFALEVEPALLAGGSANNGSKRFGQAKLISEGEGSFSEEFICKPISQEKSK